MPVPNRRRQWHATPVLLPGKSHGRRSLVGCSPCGHEESDTTEWLPFHFSLSCIGEGNGHLFQYSCLENSLDRGPWWAIVHEVSESDKTEHTYAHTPLNISALFILFFSKFRSPLRIPHLLGFLSYLVSIKLLPKPAFLSIAIESISDFILSKNLIIIIKTTNTYWVPKIHQALFWELTVLTYLAFSEQFY